MADTSKVKFGLSQVTNKTPEWANWIFRGWFIVSKALVGFIAGLAALKELNMSPLVLTVTLLIINLLLDPIMYGFSKLFGIVPDAPDPNQSLLADKQIDDKGDTSAIKPVKIDTSDQDNLHLEPVVE